MKLTDAAGCGLCIEPENGKALAEAVSQLQSEPAMAQAMGSNGRQYVTRHFAREAITDRYRVALESLVESQPALVGEVARSASLSSE